MTGGGPTEAEALLPTPCASECCRNAAPNAAGAFVHGNPVLSWVGNNSKKLGLEAGAPECCECLLFCFMRMAVCVGFLVLLPPPLEALC